MENDDLELLKEEVKYLKKRIEVLEKTENHRRVNRYIRAIIKILAILFLAFAVWRGYDYVVNNIPKIIEEKIKSFNPLKK